MTTAPYMLTQPDALRCGVVFSSPHSGRNYPAAFVESSRLNQLQLRSSEDAFVDELFGFAPQCGAPLIAATVPRAFVDLNRSADELDPALIADLSVRGTNPRVAAGLGVIPRVVSEGRVIRHGKMSRHDAQDRIAMWYRPYHSALRSLLEDARSQFGQAVLIDCHSMPHEALSHSTAAQRKRPDIVIGDRYGASCDIAIVDEISAIFHHAGFRVGRNTPFAGAFITQHYGRPSSNQHAVQIEIDRSLYMDERRIKKRPEFAQVQACLSSAIEAICDLFAGMDILAAE